MTLRLLEDIAMQKAELKARRRIKISIFIIRLSWFDYSLLSLQFPMETLDFQFHAEAFIPRDLV